ncbi:MAG: hypothetical protein P8J44_07610, partial [Gammaproteobacteria bacterium]|nr:hypothetical protein [Gammaproteobacteria bacterium]
FIINYFFILNIVGNTELCCQSPKPLPDHLVLLFLTDPILAQLKDVHKNVYNSWRRNAKAAPMTHDAFQ